MVMREGWGSKRALLVPGTIYLPWTCPQIITAPLYTLTELRTKKNIPSDFARVDPSFSVLDEWEFHNSRVEFRSSDPRESRSDTEYFLMTIRFKMRRRYEVYLGNIVLYMFFITLMSLSCFALRDISIVGERMGLAVTLLLTAIAFQDIVFDQLPNVAYLTLLHKYIIFSFMYIAAVAIQSAATAVQTVSWFDTDGPFNEICFYIFVFVFIAYHLYFMVTAGWLRHWESKKLYMDSEQLESYVEDMKHQFKMQWKVDPKKEDFRGKSGRIASFTDFDPQLRKDQIDRREVNSFFQFCCLWIWYGLLACIKCKCCRCQTHSQKRMAMAHARKTSRNLLEQKSYEQSEE